MSSHHEEKKAVSAAGATSKAAPGLARHGATKRPHTSGEAKWAEPKSTRPDVREPKDDSPAGAAMKAVPAKRRS